MCRKHTRRFGSSVHERTPCGLRACSLWQACRTLRRQTSPRTAALSALTPSPGARTDCPAHTPFPAGGSPWSSSSSAQRLPEERPLVSAQNRTCYPHCGVSIPFLLCPWPLYGFCSIPQCPPEMLAQEATGRVAWSLLCRMVLAALTVWVLGDTGSGTSEPTPVTGKSAGGTFYRTAGTRHENAAGEGACG